MGRAGRRGGGMWQGGGLSRELCAVVTAGTGYAGHTLAEGNMLRASAATSGLFRYEGLLSTPHTPVCGFEQTILLAYILRASGLSCTIPAGKPCAFVSSGAAAPPKRRLAAARSSARGVV